MITTKSAKSKGRKLQVHIKNRIIEKFWWLKDGDVDSCSMGSGGVDIKLSPLGIETFPISIEAKKGRKHPARKEMEQSRANAYGNTIPAIVWCPHGSGLSKSMITFDLNDFLDFYIEVATNKLQKIQNRLNYVDEEIRTLQSIPGLSATILILERILNRSVSARLLSSGEAAIEIVGHKGRQLTILVLPKNSQQSFFIESKSELFKASGFITNGKGLEKLARWIKTGRLPLTDEGLWFKEKKELENPDE